MRNGTGRGVGAWIATLWLVGLVPGVGCMSGAVAAPDDRPNIVLIVADDLGWTDLGCYGSRYYQTPHLDRLAAAGVRFTSAYTSGSNCAPTRAALMSGLQYPHNPVYTVGSGARGKASERKLEPVKNAETLPAHFVTLAETLRAAGYATGHFGKWHLGDPGEAGPSEQGFDVNVAGNHTGSPAGGYFSPYRNPQLDNGPRGEYLTDRLTDEAVKFIEAHRERPFFVYMPHYAVHTPIQAPDDRVAQQKKIAPVGKHDNPTYGAMVAALDDSVGRITQTLERLGLTDRTIVLFYSDNGGLGGYGPDANHVTDNAPLRGGKGNFYEGGIRVPLIVRYPGVAPAGSTCATPVVSTDFYPTLAALARAPLPDGLKPDGVDFTPLLRDPAHGTVPRDALVWHFPGYLQGYGTPRWRATPCGVIRAGDFKLIEFFEDNRVELYNLADDPAETTDLATQNPTQTRALLDQLHAWRKTNHAPMPTKKSD